MNKDKLYNLLQDVKDKKISPEEAMSALKDLPFKDLDFVKFDHHRNIRKQIGEVIYCPGKAINHLESICKEVKKSGQVPVIYSRVSEEQKDMLLSIDNSLQYNESARMVYKKNNNIKPEGLILVLTGGTSDIPVAEEAACTAEVIGNNVERHFDVGVAGIHRLFSVYDSLQKANVIIAVAGMEGALPSIVAGLVDCPLIAVPTSVGYGANFNGMSALLTMLNSCAPGISVVNIDNGFGAGYIASQINKKKV